MREFTQLSKYGIEMLVSEDEKCRKFEVALMTIFGPMSPDFAMMFD